MSPCFSSLLPSPPPPPPWLESLGCGAQTAPASAAANQRLPHTPAAANPQQQCSSASSPGGLTQDWACRPASWSLGSNPSQPGNLHPLVFPPSPNPGFSGPQPLLPPTQEFQPPAFSSLKTFGDGHSPTPQVARSTILSPRGQK